ncbi:MAG: tRNA (mo5U34)-methyltransferase [Desulfobacteraceae bacterium Eth-SRB2]|nr:MAG: tRNA (mo5U34)-methyltransferase [Desulfobacteraceae bacterium Eth-SRB2]
MINQQKSIAEEFLQATKAFNEGALQLGFGDLSNYYWYHTVELPNGLITPGQYDFRATISSFHFPENMQGMTVLDVGSATGYFAFEFEKRGARVTSVEIPSLESLDRFPGQNTEQLLRKIEKMMKTMTRLDEARTRYSAKDLYFYLLKGPFEFCQKLLNSRVERCLSTVYDLSDKLAGTRFDLVFMGDILLHTLNPLQALAAVTPLCDGTLILSQVIPDAPDGTPVLIYVGGDDLNNDEISWWLPNKLFLEQLLKKFGFKSVLTVGTHSGTLKPAGFPFVRSVLHASR